MGILYTNQFTTNFIPSIVLLAATAIGSSLPDIDEYNSKVSRKSLINFSLFLRHRGITHSLLGWILFSTGLYFLMNHFIPIDLSRFNIKSSWNCLWLGIVIGYLLHLFEDSFSHQGVEWFAPLKKKANHHLISYKVGGFLEKTVTFFAIVGIALMSFYWIARFI